MWKHKNIFLYIILFFPSECLCQRKHGILDFPRVFCLFTLQHLRTQFVVVVPALWQKGANNLEKIWIAWTALIFYHFVYNIILYFIVLPEQHLTQATIPQSPPPARKNQIMDCSSRIWSGSNIVCTSASRLLRLGLTKSVVVIRSSGTKNNLTLKRFWSSNLTSDKNLVLVWNVLQGTVHGDFV